MQSAPIADDRARDATRAESSTWPPGTAAQPSEVARASRSSFLTAFVLLPAPRRNALAAVYAFCRVVDDAGDEAPTAQLARDGLAFWTAELDAIEQGGPRTPIGRAVATAVHEFGVATSHLREVIDGVRMDTEGQRYRTLAELDGYCRKVASAVGLACLPVFGARSAGARAYADELGLALQLTNILRDLCEDARDGRVYVPSESLAKHGVEVAWLDGSGPESAYRTGGPVDGLVAGLAAVARARFARAADLLPREERRALAPARVMGEVYAALLRRIEARGGRLDLPRRVRVPRIVKLAILVRAILRQKLGPAG